MAGEAVKYVFQVVANGGDGKGYAATLYQTEAELLAAHTMTGRNSCAHNRAELQGQPVLKGLLGPMYNGERAPGLVCIRYESQEVYNELSR